MTGLTVKAENGQTTVFGTRVSNLQSNISVSGDAITGTLKYLDSGALAEDWGAGNFLCLKFSDVPESATSVKVGLDPSEGSGLVELLGDPDMNGVFKITDKDTQKFKIVTTNGYKTNVQTFDLSGLTCNES